MKQITIKVDKDNFLRCGSKEHWSDMIIWGECLRCHAILKKMEEIINKEGLNIDKQDIVSEDEKPDVVEEVFPLADEDTKQAIREEGASDEYNDR